MMTAAEEECEDDNDLRNTSMDGSDMTDGEVYFLENETVNVVAVASNLYQTHEHQQQEQKHGDVTKCSGTLLQTMIDLSFSPISPHLPMKQQTQPSTPTTEQQQHWSSNMMYCQPHQHQQQEYQYQDPCCEAFTTPIATDGMSRVQSSTSLFGENIGRETQNVEDIDALYDDNGMLDITKMHSGQQNDDNSGGFNHDVSVYKGERGNNNNNYKVGRLFSGSSSTTYNDDGDGTSMTTPPSIAPQVPLSSPPPLTYVSGGMYQYSPPTGFSHIEFDNNNNGCCTYNHNHTWNSNDSLSLSSACGDRQRCIGGGSGGGGGSVPLISSKNQPIDQTIKNRPPRIPNGPGRAGTAILLPMSVSSCDRNSSKRKDRGGQQQHSHHQSQQQQPAAQRQHTRDSSTGDYSFFSALTESDADHTDGCGGDWDFQFHGADYYTTTNTTSSSLRSTTGSIRLPIITGTQHHLRDNKAHQHNRSHSSPIVFTTDGGFGTQTTNNGEEVILQQQQQSASVRMSPLPDSVPLGLQQPILLDDDDYDNEVESITNNVVMCSNRHHSIVVPSNKPLPVIATMSQYRSDLQNQGSLVVVPSPCKQQQQQQSSTDQKEPCVHNHDALYGVLLMDQKLNHMHL